MSASVYAGESRAIPRWTVLIVALLGTVGHTWMLLFEPRSGHTRADSPFFLVWPAEHRALAIAIALVVVVSISQIARRRHLGWGVAGLSALAWLSESQAALTGFQERHLFVGGAALTGWIFGLAFSHALDRKLVRPSDPRRDDAFGEAGAAGVFAANYLGAVTSKLLTSGLGWADSSSFLSTLVGRHTFTGGMLDSLLAVVIAHPALARGLALFTLAIQASAILFLLGPRLRMLSGTLLIGFHVGAFALMGVKYALSIVIALALSYPWPRWIRALTRSWPAPVPEDAASVAESLALPDVARQAASWIAVAGGLALASWLTIHADDATRLFVEPDHGARESDGQPAREPPRPGVR